MLSSYQKPNLCIGNVCYGKWLVYVYFNLMELAFFTIYSSPIFKGCSVYLNFEANHTKNIVIQKSWNLIYTNLYKFSSSTNQQEERNALFFRI